MKFGVPLSDARRSNRSAKAGGGATRRASGGDLAGCNEADITRDADFNVQRWDSDFFFSDTYKVSIA